MSLGAARSRLAAPLALVLSGLLVGCGEPATRPSSASVAGDRVEGPPTAQGPTAQGRFVEAADAGFVFRHAVGDPKLDNLVESVGAGGCVLDFDGDGRMDVYLAGQGWHEGLSDGPAPAEPGGSGALYRNVPGVPGVAGVAGDGGAVRFADVTAKAGLSTPGFYAFGAVAGDVDGDGHPDLYVYGLDANRLFRNRGDGTFEDVTARAGVGDPRASIAAAFFDADHDGDLDLYVGNYVAFDKTYRLHYGPDGFPGPLAYLAQPDAFYRNRGDGTFEDATEAAGLASVLPGRAMGVSILDADGDGHPDVYVANDASANFLFLNDGTGRFREAAVAAGVAFGFYGEATASMAAAVGDLHGHGRPDLLVTDASFGSLYRNLGGGRFQDRVRAAGYAHRAAAWAHWGPALLDLDNDGDLDVYAAAADLHYETGRRDLLLENRGDGTFDDLAPRGGPWFARDSVTRAALVLDADDDGRLDLLVTRISGTPVLLRNAGERERTGTGVLLALAGPPRGRDAVGTRLVVEAGGRRIERVHQLATGYLGQHDPRVHFGLGAATRIDRIVVTWPDGSTLERRDVPVGGAAGHVVTLAWKEPAR